MDPITGHITFVIYILIQSTTCCTLTRWYLTSLKCLVISAFPENTTIGGLSCCISTSKDGYLGFVSRWTLFVITPFVQQVWHFVFKWHTRLVSNYKFVQACQLHQVFPARDQSAECTCGNGSITLRRDTWGHLSQNGTTTHLRCNFQLNSFLFGNNFRF